MTYVSQIVGMEALAMSPKSTRSLLNGSWKLSLLAFWRCYSKSWISTGEKFMCPLGSCSKLLITSIKGNNYFCLLFLSPKSVSTSPYSTVIFYSVSHAHAWKFLKPHMFAIIQDVLFPIMSHSPADQELWETDPYEYIRVKFGKIMCIA